MSTQCLAIFLRSNGKENLLYQLDSFNFLIRGKVKEVINMAIRESIDRSQPNSILDFELDINQVYCIYCVGVVVDNENCAFIITSETPPHNHLRTLARKLILVGSIKSTMDENFEYISSDLKIKQIQNILDDTKMNLYDDIQKLMDRESRLEDIINKTKHLEESTKDFLIKAKEMNRCCLIL